MKTSDFFKNGIKDMSFCWAEVIENEGDFIFDDDI